MNPNTGFGFACTSCRTTAYERQELTVLEETGNHWQTGAKQILAIGDVDGPPDTDDGQIDTPDHPDLLAAGDPVASEQFANYQPSAEAGPVQSTVGAANPAAPPQGSVREPGVVARHTPAGNSGSMALFTLDQRAGLRPTLPLAPLRSAARASGRWAFYVIVQQRHTGAGTR
ncbi:hypothetical protein [Streptomyces sp. MAR4 CNX-425]|uniref:hypothetical protein n=1 Tax=Streptomyces sp. MAR4 CNX-425 TaxID=3406343 RepID=UPI003B50CEAE